MVIIIHKVLLTSTMFHLIDLDKVAVLFYIYKSVREQVSKVLKSASWGILSLRVKANQGDDNLYSFLYIKKKKMSTSESKRKYLM